MNPPMKVDPRKMVSGRKPEVASYNPFDDSMNSNNMVQYVSVGAAAIAMGVCIFLYKEVKKLKSDMNDLTDEIKKLENNEQLEENTKTIQSLEEKVNQIATLMQHMAMRAGPKPPSMVTPEPIPVTRVSVVTSEVLPVKKDSEESIEDLPGNENTKIVNGGPTIDCEGGICDISTSDAPEDTKKSKNKTLKI